MNRTRGFFLSTVLCGGVLALGLISASSAQAAMQEQVFRPQGSWAVSKVEAKGKSAPYCALARRFGNGSVLTMARNTSNETSLAVDFPKGALTDGKEMSVVLDPGQGESRTYQTQPVSERGIVIRMGRDDNFYSALSDSGRLEINLNDQSYVFAVADMDSGMSDLAACLGPMTEPAAGEPQPSPTQVSAPAEIAAPAALVEETLSVPSAQTGDIQALQEENIRLKNALERERRAFEDRFQQMNDNSSASNEMSEKLRLLEIENRELRMQGKSGDVSRSVAMPAMPVPKCEPVEQVSAPMAQPDQKMMDEVTALREENARLIVEIDSQKQMMARMDADMKAMSGKQAMAGDAVAASSAELMAARKQADDAKAITAQMESQIEKLQSENEIMKADLAQKAAAPQPQPDQKADLALLTKVKTLETQLSTVTSERDRMSAEISKIRSADADGRVAIASSNWDLEVATKRFNEAEREIRRLGSELEQEKARCSVEKKDLEYMLFDPKITEKEQLSKLMSLEKELDQTKEELKKARAEPVSKPQDQDVIAALRGEVSSLNAQIRNLESEKIAMAESMSRITPAAGDTVRAVRSAPVPLVSAVEVSAVDYGAVVTDMSQAKAPPKPIEKAVLAPAASAAIGGSRMMSADQVNSMLGSAGVSVSGGVNPSGNAEGGKVSYRWEAEGLFGTLEQKPQESAAQFDRFVKDYLGKTKSRCSGEFASMPAMDETTVMGRVAAYEIACVDGNGGASAALMFLGRDGVFTTIAHESAPESMDDAMDARDKIIAVVQAGKFASR